MQRILLVDHDQSFRIVYSESLTRQNYTVDTASGSQEALDKLRKHEYRALITEILLPGKNGLRLIQSIRQDHTLIKLPVIILTSLEPADIGIPSSLSDALGIHAYIVKHQSHPDQLMQALSALPAR
ncbi:MAG: response regulator [Candidatus Saccharibacteria bacterium]